MSETYLNIAVDAPLRSPLTYKLADHENSDWIGSVVSVPLGKRTARGIVLNKLSSIGIPPDKVRAICQRHDEFPILNEPYLKWLQWMSQYYHHPIGQIGQMFLPPLDKKDGKSRKSDVIPRHSVDHQPIKLSREQQRVVEAILEENKFKTHLLYGITGSGKTEVYLETIRLLLKKGEQALFLVPEISLTPQLVRRFSERFGEDLAVIHSHLTQREKTNQWWSIVEGKKKILIGARSALFCPFPNLKLIILDEEHDSSFKQDEKLKYHARDSAIVLGQILNIPVILGSATPSLESWKNALDGKYLLHTLDYRYKNIQLPTIEVIDMRLESSKSLDLPRWLSPQLYQKAKEHLENGKQIAFFLNRRGVAKSVFCQQCGHIKLCPNCDVSLTLHGESHLVCHYCDYHENKKRTCEHCHLGEYSQIGSGTEKIETDLNSLFPQFKIIRLDRDEIQTRDDLNNAIEQIEANTVQIIIGTQMIAKGLDFKNLSLVGVVLADIGFNVPDFRAGEHNFQLLTQVSGRSGRHDNAGSVFIQTYNTDHLSLKFAQTHSFQEFARLELENRKDLNYPPYGRLACIRIQGLNLSHVKLASKKIKNYSQQISSQTNRFKTIQTLGPAPATLTKLKNKFRYNMIIKAPTPTLMNLYINQLELLINTLSNVQISIDIDPHHIP